MDRQYKEYDKDELRKLQLVQLEMLKDFITICNKYELDYFVDGGTCIGTVRHKGFIPWDDDIDVAMPRKDVEKFMEVLDREMGDKYKMMTPLIDRNYSCNVIKMQKKGTKFVPTIGKDMKCDWCIDIDIFPLDKMPEDKKLAQRQLRRTWVLNKMIFLCGVGNPIVPLSGVKKYLAVGVIKVVHFLLKLFHVSPAYLYRLMEKEETRYNNTDSRCYNDFRSAVAYKQFIFHDEMYPLQDMEFEGIMVKMPHDYDAYLTRSVGTYMELPPVEQRVNHHPYLLDFGEEDND